jgi:hypothetical protein
MYIQSPQIRKHTDGWCFVFMNGDYYGAFNEYCGLLAENVVVHDMYPLIIGEISESIVSTDVQSNLRYDYFKYCTVS